MRLDSMWSTCRIARQRATNLEKAMDIVALSDLKGGGINVNPDEVTHIERNPATVVNATSVEFSGGKYVATSESLDTVADKLKKYITLIVFTKTKFGKVHTNPDQVTHFHIDSVTTRLPVIWFSSGKSVNVKEDLDFVEDALKNADKSDRFA
jgi:uncharacterized protein YlzI (FlbEa/FlbD family)